MVLVIEDEKLSRVALGKLLAQNGYTSEAFETADEALGVLSQGHTPDLALVDLDMPGQSSGAEVVRFLSENAPRTRPVLITAAEKERILKLGLDHITYLRKPIDFNDLMDLLTASQALN
jgi:CheY-like chemotaxis protein